MTLEIRIVKTPHNASLPQNNHIFDERGGTIGRGPDNTWILPDPERILSSKHCELVFEAGCYHLIDLSTNGTFINGSPEPLGKGARAQLAHGDSVEIGDYCFAVTMDSDAHESIFSIENESLALGSPFASPSEADFLQSPFGTDYLADQPPLSLNPEGDSVDPLLALDKARGSGSADALFSGQLSDPARDFLFSPAQDHVTGEQFGTDAVAWPDSVPENVIPDDWDLDVGLGLTPSHNALLDEQNTRGDKFDKPSLASFESSSIPPQEFVEQPQRYASDPPPAQFTAEVRGSRQAAAEFLTHQSPEPLRAPAVQIRQPSIRRAKGKEQAQSEQQGDRLIEAMGLDPSRFDQADRDELHTLVGGLMRDVVEGLMQAMRARASIKNQFRMNVTTIQPVENNPLKFSADVTEAMENIFVRRSNAYKPPAEAVQEGFKEIAGHQMAMIAGMREAFEEMLKAFGPSRLEQSFRRQQKRSFIGVLQNARYWRQYQAHYEGLTDNLERSFQQIFGDVFVQAYEDQLRRLAATRKV